MLICLIKPVQIIFIQKLSFKTGLELLPLNLFWLIVTHLKSIFYVLK